MIDKKQIIEALKLWFHDGDVFEIRVLEAVTSNMMYPHTQSGYFDYSNIEKVADDIANLRSYRGVYATVNPVKTDLLARAYNRIRAVKKDPTTSDADILERRWLLIDCDAVRPSGVSSSDEEHQAAHEKALNIKNSLTSLGWHEPIFCDSGNGAQLMYKIELPAKDENLIQHCLEALAIASDDKVNIDLTVHNPARIWRLPGTMNCKGDSIPERPHRMAKILSAPEKIDIISKEKLEYVASFIQNRKTKSAENTSTNTFSSKTNTFDIDEWIAKYNLDVRDPQPYDGGRKWLFKVCPFNSDHTDKSAVLIQQSNGAISFTCHHNGCVGNDWHKLRELFEPNCYDKKINDDSDINIDGIMEQAKPKEEKNEVLFPNPGTIPESLMNIPGFVEEVVQLSLSTAPYPNRVLSFTGALSLLALLIGRKMQDKRDNRSNLYFIALADSGTGKDHPRKVNFNIAHRVGVANLIGDSFASGEGLEDALFMHPSMLFQADEFDCIFNTLKYAKDNRAESINEKLLKFYGASNTLYPMRKKALSKRHKDDSERDQNIINPNLVLFGTAVPQYFYESLSRRVLENGLVARCIMIEAGKRGEAGNPAPITPSDSLLRAAKYLADFDVSGNLTSEYPKPLIVSEDAEATARLKEIQIECDKQYNFFESKNENGAKALWARAHEKICKLAMLHGVSTNVYNPIITKKSVEWAWRFVKHLTDRMLYQANGYVYENVFDEKCQKAIRYIRQAGGLIAHSKLLHQSHESADTLKKIIETLIEKQSVEIVFESNGRSIGKKYKLLE